MIGLFQIIYSRCWVVVGISNFVFFYVGVGEFFFVIIELLGGQGGVGQEDEVKQSDYVSYCIFDNEEFMGFISKLLVRR